MYHCVASRLLELCMQKGNSFYVCSPSTPRWFYDILFRSVFSIMQHYYLFLLGVGFRVRWQPELFSPPAVLLSANFYFDNEVEGFCLNFRLFICYAKIFACLTLCEGILFLDEFPWLFVLTNPIVFHCTWWKWVRVLSDINCGNTVSNNIDSDVTGLYSINLELIKYPRVEKKSDCS